jgi:glutathione S-transferase
MSCVLRFSHYRSNLRQSEVVRGVSMYILYGGDFTRAGLVQWVLEVGGLPHQVRKVDILMGEHRSDAFLAINPAGLVPVLITPEGVSLYEAAALMLYLADRHNLTELAPAVGDPLRGRFLASHLYIASDIQAEMKRFHFPHRYAVRSEDNVAVLEMSKTLLLSRLEVVNTRLIADGPYLLGQRFSMADFYLCFWIAYLHREDVCNRYPAIARLYDLVRAQSRAACYLDETEQMAKAYTELMKQNPGGVVA